MPREVTIVRTLDAPRELVWKVWTEQNHIAAWWGPNGFTSPVCDWKATAGNKLYLHMKSPEGQVNPVGGEFVEVIPPEKLVFINGLLDEKGELMFEAMNTILLETQGQKTKMTLHSHIYKVTPAIEPHIDEMSSGMKEGWNQSLDKMEKVLYSLK